MERLRTSKIEGKACWFKKVHFTRCFHGSRTVWRKLFWRNIFAKKITFGERRNSKISLYFWHNLFFVTFGENDEYVNGMSCHKNLNLFIILSTCIVHGPSMDHLKRWIHGPLVASGPWSIASYLVEYFENIHIVTTCKPTIFQSLCGTCMNILRQEFHALLILLRVGIISFIKELRFLNHPFASLCIVYSRSKTLMRILFIK